MDRYSKLILLALFSRAVRIDATSANPREGAVERAVLQQKIEADRCHGHTGNDLTDADRAANVISDEIVELGWNSKHRTRPDHPVRLICVEVNPYESSRG